MLLLSFPTTTTTTTTTTSSSAASISYGAEISTFQKSVTRKFSNSHHDCSDTIDDTQMIEKNLTCAKLC